MPRKSTRITLCALTLTTALAAVVQVAAPAIPSIVGALVLVLQAKFVYGSGGTTAKVWIQTSIDGGASWFDIANFAFTTANANKLHVIGFNPATPFVAGTTPGAQALADNTILPGILGDRFRAVVTTTGTYAGGTTLTVDVIAKSGL